MEPTSPIGDWHAELREFIIADGPGGLAVRFPEAPPGYDARLVETEAGRFRMEGGPFPGAELVPDDGGWSVGGYIPLTRLDRTAEFAPGAGLTPPPLELQDDEEEAFVELYARIDHPANIWQVELAGQPAHRFVQWLMGSDLVIFHGSKQPGLDQVEPVRDSRKLFISEQQAELEAVYGSHDGLWAMFFAIIDRSVGDGVRNSVNRFHSSRLGDLDLYHFSLPRPDLARRPFTSGTLYLLPRERFECLPLYPGGPRSSEWACRTPVRPLARMPVAPNDFPFLDQIGGHEEAS